MTIPRCALFSLLVLCSLLGFPDLALADPKADGVQLPLSAAGCVFFVTTAQAKASPMWNDALGDPPLSLEDAAKAAEAYVHTNGFPEARFTRISLSRLEGYPNKWYFAVGFGGSRSRSIENSRYETVVVLMNREIVAPRPAVSSPR